MCATKLHRAKIDGPAVAGPSFFAIRWRAKLHPEAIIKVRSGLFNFVLLFLIKQKCVKCLRELLPFYQRQPQAACTPGGFSVCNEIARSENRRSRGSGAVVFRVNLRRHRGGG